MNPCCRVLYCALLLAVLLPSHPVRAADSLDATLEAFAATTGITHWPRLDGCGYENTRPDITLGLFLRVGSGGNTAQGRWDGRCHVPPRSQIKGWPADQPAGVHVVAARLLIKARYEPPVVEILAVLPGQHPPQEMEAAVERRICRPAPPGAETDRGCEQLARSRR